MSTNKPCTNACTTACTVGALMSAAAGGGLVVYATVASRGADEMDASTVLDVAVIVIVLVASTVLLWMFNGLLAPLLRQAATNRWEIVRLSRELHDTRLQLVEMQPTAKAIAGYAMAALLRDEDDQGAEVVNLRG